MISILPEEHFEDFFDEKKCIFINLSQTWSKKIPAVFGKFFDGLLKLASHVSIGRFCAKVFLEKSKTFYFFRTVSETLSAFFRKIVCKDVENAIYVSIGLF